MRHQLGTPIQRKPAIEIVLVSNRDPKRLGHIRRGQMVAGGQSAVDVDRHTVERLLAEQACADRLARTVFANGAARQWRQPFRSSPSATSR